MKVFILRVLEDKGIIKHILSNGGFKLWKEITERLSIFGNGGLLRLDLLLRLATEFVRDEVFSDIEKNILYDWYVPDDGIFLDLLEVLCKYKFSEVKQDIVGYIYERLMSIRHRHNLGIYLTPPELVEYTLDRAEYEEKQIIGKRVLDPACGSGGFLVHAVRRYRKALELAGMSELEVAKKFIKDVQENFWGIDINAFSIYLAGINLFIQLLDDFLLLMNEGQIDKAISFNLYTENTLRYVRKMENERFDYVFSNPPYVNPKVSDIKLQEVGRSLIESLVGNGSVAYGDLNTYSMFLFLSAYLLKDGGSIGFVVPLTLLGDMQTEKLRRWLDEKGSVVHITRFMRRNILFDGVTQAVITFVWKKGVKEINPTISFGGHKESDRKEMIEEARKNLISVNRVSFYDDKRDFLYWIVINQEDNSRPLICMICYSTRSMVIRLLENTLPI